MKVGNSFTFDPPTQHVDGTTLTDLTYFNFYYGATNVFGLAAFLVKYTADETTFVTPLVGVYYYFVTSLDAGGRESLPTSAFGLDSR